MQQSSKRTVTAVLLSVALVVGCALLVKFALRGYAAFSAAREISKLHKVQPTAAHSPAEVVGFQLAALRQVDQPHPGAGMELLYAFLAPSRRDTVGGLDQLTALFTTPPYQDLVGFHSARLGDTRIAGNQAQQVVLVLTPDNRLAAYVFLLTRQEEGAYEGAWMTVALLPMRLQIGPDPQPIPPTADAPAGLPRPEE